MATAATENRNDSSPTANNDDPISAAVESQLSLVSSFHRWLARRGEVDGDRNGIISRIQNRLDDYRQWLTRHQHQATAGDITEDNEPWAMDVRSRRDDGLLIAVTGPGSDRPIEIVARDDEDAEYLTSDNYLGYMNKMCHAFADAQRTLRSLLEVTNEVEMEESQLSQPPEDTVKMYIRQLREYNDVKDIGQQLIGVIAENRGVPIRTLYESGEFGVNIPH